MTKLEELIAEINRFEAIISDWDESQRCVAVGLKRAIEDLHKEALTRLIKSLKQESMSALRHAADDEVVYAVLLYHDLVKPPLPPILQRIQTALEEVRPGLKSHKGDIELVAFKPPDTVEVKLIGTCSSCPASNLTLTQGVEQAIKNHCPEINQVVAVSDRPTGDNSNTNIISPFSPQIKAAWVKVATIDQVSDLDIFATKVAGHALILYRQGDRINCYRNACSHLASPLDTGQVENGILTCPIHGFQYQLATGECLTAADVPLQAYPVQIKGEKVFVQFPR
ncbi:NifU family protein [Nostoc sp. FACHB-110]|uniref:NifU family protein n=1 Tax=Nostoc sp. FACHB-110 TaxID=2692834 RepID=UPI00168A3A6D|nr:NifU family protein [Nostoc sp. FACHB-110]MBD2440211.1 NifU family protein [Nostoc sp. FACHB-110]